MGKLRIPRVNTLERMTVTPAISEVLYDENLRELFVGDGATVGGIRVSLGHLRISDGTTTLNDIEEITFTGGSLSGSGTTGVVTIGTAPPNRAVLYAEGGDIFGNSQGLINLGTVRVQTADSYNLLFAGSRLIRIQVVNGGLYELYLEAEKSRFSTGEISIFRNSIEIPDTAIEAGLFSTGGSIGPAIFTNAIVSLNAGDIIDFRGVRLEGGSGSLSLEQFSVNTSIQRLA